MRWIFLYGVTQGLKTNENNKQRTVVGLFTTDADNNSSFLCKLRRPRAFYFIFIFLLWMPFYIIITISVNFILYNFIVIVMFYSCETYVVNIKKQTNDGDTPAFYKKKWKRVE